MAIVSLILTNLISLSIMANPAGELMKKAPSISSALLLSEMSRTMAWKFPWSVILAVISTGIVVPSLFSILRSIILVTPGGIPRISGGFDSRSPMGIRSTRLFPTSSERLKPSNWQALGFTSIYRPLASTRKMPSEACSTRDL